MAEATNPYAAYGYTDEEWLYKQSLREFCEKEMEPHWKEAYDPKTCEQFERTFYKRLAVECNAIDNILPEEVGGLGQSMKYNFIVIEEVARVSAGLAIAVTSAAQFALAMLMSCPAAWEKWGKGVMSGDILLTQAMCSPEGQSNFAEQAEVISFDEDTQEWVLNGNKAYSSSGAYADVTKMTGLYKGTTYDIYVPKGTPGVTMQANPELGCGTEAASFTLDNVRVPKEFGAMAPIYVDHKLATSFTPSPFTLGVAALALGGAESAYDKTVAYLSGRTNNFKPITAIGSIQYKLAWIKSKLLAMRSMVTTALNFILVNNNPKEAALLTHATKAFCCDTARQITDECIQMWGCAGYNTDSGMMRFNLDAIGYSIGTCTSEMHMGQIAFELGFPEARESTI